MQDLRILRLLLVKKLKLKWYKTNRVAKTKRACSETFENQKEIFQRCVKEKYSEFLVRANVFMKKKWFLELASRAKKFKILIARALFPCFFFYITRRVRVESFFSYYSLTATLVMTVAIIIIIDWLIIPPPTLIID